MRAIVVPEANGPLLLQEVADPVPGAGEVLVRVSACGVCYRDLVDRKGLYPWMQFPNTPGHEFAGVVEAVGEGVEGISIGDRVVNLHRAPCGECSACLAGEDGRCEVGVFMYGHTAQGGYAERVIAHPKSLVSVPEGLSLEEASFLNCTAAVALRALRRHAKVSPGETVLVTGASGGVGLHGLEVARRLGAKTIAVTSSEEKAARLQGLADKVLVAPPGEFHREARGMGVDVALDCVGTPTLNASLRSLRPGGRLVIVGNVDQTRFALNPGYMILYEIQIFGSAVSSRRDLEDVLDWAARGEIKPHLGARLPLEKAEEAQEKLRERVAWGRTVLIP